MTSLRLGVLRLVDSAPALVAQADGLFAACGLEARIEIEPSWANILDKLTWGLLDAAVVMPPLAIAACLGLRGTRAKLVIPMGLTSGGNSVVVGRPAWQALDGVSGPQAQASALLGWMRQQKARPRLGVVHAYSSHNLLLRDWLRAAGGVAERDWETVVVPPEQIAGVLGAGEIAGFCAGAPWGEVAAVAGAGQVLLGGSSLWPGHPEKCLAVSLAWAQAHPAGLTALLRAMLRAGAICNTVAAAGRVATLLGQVGLPHGPSLKALPGGEGPERVCFASAAAADAIASPDPAHGAWFLNQMRGCGWVAATDGAAEVASLYRPDMLLPAWQAESGSARHDLPAWSAENQAMPTSGAGSGLEKT